MCYHWIDKDLTPDTPKDTAWESWWWKHGQPKARDLTGKAYVALCQAQRAAFERDWAARKPHPR